MAQYLPPSQRHLLDFPPLGVSSSQVSVDDHGFGAFDEELDKMSDGPYEVKLCTLNPSATWTRPIQGHTNQTSSSLQGSSRSRSRTGDSARGGRRHNQSWDGGRRRSTESSSRCRPPGPQRARPAQQAVKVRGDASCSSGAQSDDKLGRRCSIQNPNSSSHENGLQSQDGSLQGKTQDEIKRLKPMKLQFWKTKMCPWVVSHGHCRKESACRYAHAEAELRPLPDLSKTKMCEAFVQTGRCPNLDRCKYAHSSEELRATTSFSKTKLCPLWLNGCCNSKETCRFAHGEQELRTAINLSEVHLVSGGEHFRAEDSQSSLREAPRRSVIGMHARLPDGYQAMPSVAQAMWEAGSVDMVRDPSTRNPVPPGVNLGTNSAFWQSADPNTVSYPSGAYAATEDAMHTATDYPERAEVQSMRPPMHHASGQNQLPVTAAAQPSVRFQEPSLLVVPTMPSADIGDTNAVRFSPPKSYMPTSASYPCFPMVPSVPPGTDGRPNAVSLISLSSAPVLDGWTPETQPCASPPALSPMSLQFATNALVYLSEVQWSENQNANRGPQAGGPGSDGWPQAPQQAVRQGRSRATSAAAATLNYCRPHMIGSPIRGFTAASREVGGVTVGQAGPHPSQLVFASPAHGGRMWAIQPTAPLTESPLLLSPSIRPAAGDPNRFMAHLLPSGILSPISQASFHSSPATAPFDLFVSFPSNNALDSVSTQKQSNIEAIPTTATLPADAVHDHTSAPGNVCIQPKTIGPVYVGASPNSPHPGGVASQRPYFQASPGMPIMHLTPHTVAPWARSLVSRVLSPADSSFVLPPSANCSPTPNLENPDESVRKVLLSSELLPAQCSPPSSAILTTLGLFSPRLVDQGALASGEKQRTVSDASLERSAAKLEFDGEIQKGSEFDEDALAATEQPGSDASFTAMQSPDYSPSLFSSKSSSACTSSPQQAQKNS